MSRPLDDESVAARHRNIVMVQRGASSTIYEILFRHGMIMLFRTAAMLASAPSVPKDVFLTLITKQTQPTEKGRDMFFSDRAVGSAKNKLGFQPPSGW